MDRYVSALIRQLEELAPRCRANPVDTVYFGGGTPSYLGVKRLKKIVKAVFHGYQVTKDPEITLEANPDSLADKRTVSALRRAGINRISLGVQSADDGSCGPSAGSTPSPRRRRRWRPSAGGRSATCP